MDETMKQNDRTEDFSPLHKLLGTLEPLFGGSLGYARVGGSEPQFPGLCLEQCLGGSAEGLTTRGCEWLRRMAGDEQEPPLPPNGCCAKGHRIHVPAGRGSAESGRVFILRRATENPPHDSNMTENNISEAWEALLDSIEQVVQEFSRREEENIRLVEEVLQSYEQLNILFEVTKASINVSNPQEIYDFALERLSTSLRACFACFLDADGNFDRTIPKFQGADKQSPASAELISGSWREAIGKVVQDGVAQTLELGGREPGADSPSVHPLLVAPLVSGAEHLGAAVFVRPGGDPFRTGDRSMAEAVMGNVTVTAHKMRLFQDLQQMSFEVVGALVNAIDAKDKYTCGHSERVAQWSVMLGRELNFDDDYLQMLAWAGRLHDVGKIGIRDNVLGKPGRLTTEEYEHIKQHPAISYDVLKPIRRLSHVLHGVRHHHESWDGSGYPDGLAGENIPLEARVIQTADVFDALTSSRSYRHAFSVEKALRIMHQDAGSRLDPNLVTIFTRMIERARVDSPELFDHIPTDDEASAHREEGEQE
jgi:GAF domain-containing protein